MDEHRMILDYSPEAYERVCQALLHVATILGDWMEQITLIGGALPSFLISGRTLRGERAERSIWVCGPASFINVCQETPCLQAREEWHPACRRLSLFLSEKSFLGLFAFVRPSVVKEYESGVRPALRIDKHGRRTHADRDLAPRNAG